jgi:hypothetical protein
MLTPEEIQRMAERKYPDFLRSLVLGENLFPLRVRFGRPNTTDDFAKLKHEITDLARGNFGYTIEWEEKNTRRWGPQKMPLQVRFDIPDQFISALGKAKEVEQFQTNVVLALKRIPALKEWMASHVKWVVESGINWKGMLDVCEYFLLHPRPGLYTRQLPIPVHTKFIAQNRQVLASMLDFILPPNAKAEGTSFEERFGIKPLEPTIRFRTLDPAVQARLGFSHQEMALPLQLFCHLNASGLDIIITENLMNLECLPPIRGGLAIWGQGNAAELLHKVPWLGDCQIRYWGDIDEHGFHILARLRSCFPGVRSFMMDLATLERFRHWAGTGEKAGKFPSNLTPDEAAAFSLVEKENLRLEQEKIPPEYSESLLPSELARMGPAS